MPVARAIGFFSSLKTERTARKLYRTRDEAKADVLDYIERFELDLSVAHGGVHVRDVEWHWEYRLGPHHPWHHYPESSRSTARGSGELNIRATGSEASPTCRRTGTE